MSLALSLSLRETPTAAPLFALPLSFGRKDSMPDDRLISPRLGQSRKVSSLSDFEARVWQHGYLLCADDFGVMPRSAAMVRGFNRALARHSDADVFAALDKITEVGLTLTFEHQDETYLCDPVWQNFQHIRFPRRTLNPVPTEAIFGQLSIPTQQLFLSLHPSIVCGRKERDLVDVLEGYLPRLLVSEKILTWEREYRLGDYRLDLVAWTPARVILFEVKRQTITLPSLEQLLRYRAALDLALSGECLPVLVGSSLSPSLPLAELASKGVVCLLIDKDDVLSVAVNPHPTAQFRQSHGKLPASSRQDAATSREKPASGRQNSREPNHTANGLRLAASSSGGGSGGFTRFWAAYPKKVGKDAAERAWAKKGCEAHADDIITSLERQRPWLMREEGKYIPNPATWLNEGRWKDEPPPASTTRGSRQGIAEKWRDTPTGRVQL